MRFRIAIDDAAAVKALRELVRRGDDMRPLTDGRLERKRLAWFMGYLIDLAWF